MPLQRIFFVFKHFFSVFEISVPVTEEYKGIVCQGRQ